MAVENAAKAVGVLSGVDAWALWEHDVAAIVESLDDGDTDAFGEMLSAAPELVKSPDYVTMWRTRGAYGSPSEGRTAQEIATPPFARAIGIIGLRCGRVRRRCRGAPHRRPQGHRRCPPLGDQGPRIPRRPRSSHRRPAGVLTPRLFTGRRLPGSQAPRPAPRIGPLFLPSPPPVSLLSPPLTLPTGAHQCRPACNGWTSEQVPLDSTQISRCCLAASGTRSPRTRTTTTGGPPLCWRRR